MKQTFISKEVVDELKKHIQVEKYLKSNNPELVDLSSNYHPKEYQPFYVHITYEMLIDWILEKYNTFIEINYSHFKKD